ncbi:MAG: AAA family ATPase [Mailhella sp.]|nr:AAA family ATPase [Mailhella sp.]
MTEKEVEQMVTERKPSRKPFEETRFGEHDDFDREIIADNIIKLLDSDLTDCYPMAIDGGWGTGKSEFCHKLINKLRDKKDDYKPRNVIYFDAFEAENVEEPLLSLLAKITAFVPKDERKLVASKIAPVALYACKVIGKGALSHLLRQDGDELIDGLSNALHEEAQKGLDATIDGLLKQYAQAKNNIDALRTAIQTALGEKELVIFIDELDRCRPDFALNVFELVKHIFDIEGVKFIFVFNSEQIKSMIRNRYGFDVDSETYIEKFIKMSINIPQIMSSYYEVSASLRLYCLKMKEMQKDHLIKRDSFIYKFIEEFIKNNNISLRGVEKLAFSIKFLCKMKQNNPLSSSNFFLPWVLFSMVGVLIFTFNKELSRKILQENSAKEDYFNFFNVVHTIAPRNNLSKCQLISELISFEFQTEFPQTTEEERQFTQDIQEFRTAVFSNGYPSDGVLSLIKETIKTLNFCG